MHGFCLVNFGWNSVPRSFGIVDYKVRESEFFLLEVRRWGEQVNFSAVQYCAGAFATAARSVTFAMQASLKGIPEFDDWYKPRQETLRSDSLAKFFHDFRTVTNHIGESVVGGGSMRDGVTTYHFMPTPDLPNVPDMDVYDACETHYRTILKLVYECYCDLRYLVDGQWYFTKEHFEGCGKGIEDAEEEVGLLRGWTDVGKPEAEPYRWEQIRANAGGCGVEEQIAYWLEKCLPRPEPLPPYPWPISPNK